MYAMLLVAGLAPGVEAEDKSYHLLKTEIPFAQ